MSDDARATINVRLRPQDDAALVRLQRARGEAVSELIRRLIHEADAARAARPREGRAS